MTPTNPAAQGDALRDVAGETVCGFRVAAYRETHPEHGSKYGHTYSEHWSTPNSRNPAVIVERLFTETQLRAALQPAAREGVALAIWNVAKRRRWADDFAYRIIREVKSELATTPTQPAPDTTAALVEVVFGVIRNWRLSTIAQADEPSCGYPLIDAMSPDGGSVQPGIDEAGEIAFAVVKALAAHSQRPQPASDEVTK